jgi:tRNA U34 2-thiouridine synthase MnmA/TrmU
MRTDHNDQRHYTFWRQLMHAVAADAPPRVTLTTSAKVYDDQRRVPISAELHDEKFEPLNDATVSLTDPVDGPAPGQVACLMDGDLVVGHGTIAAS